MIDFITMKLFTDEINQIREMFPELGKELDRCLFEILNNHTPKCGHGTCPCQMNFELFHRERNLQFGARKKNYKCESETGNDAGE